MFRAIKGVFTNIDVESHDSIKKVNAALEEKYPIKKISTNVVDVTEGNKRVGADRRVGSSDRRLNQRRINRKFVIINRRKNEGRRLLSRGRRYVADRRDDNRENVV